MPYSERAAKAYKDAEFHVVKGGGHGFQGKTFEQAMGFIDAYLEKVGILPVNAADSVR